jgi:hypothetical protein
MLTISLSKNILLRKACPEQSRSKGSIHFPTKNKLLRNGKLILFINKLLFLTSLALQFYKNSSFNPVKNPGDIARTLKY